MLLRMLAAMCAATISCTAHASTMTGNSNVNVAIWTHTTEEHLITEVAVAGPGGGIFSFANPFAAPELTDPSAALAAALSGLGLSSGTPLGNSTTSVFGATSTFYETVDAGGAVHGADYIGDPADYSTWIALGTGDVNVTVDQYTTNYTFYRLQTSIVTSQPAAVPLPAAGLLLVGALGGLGTLRSKRRTA